MALVAFWIFRALKLNIFVYSYVNKFYSFCLTLSRKKNKQQLSKFVFINLVKPKSAELFTQPGLSGNLLVQFINKLTEKNHVFG